MVKIIKLIIDVECEHGVMFNSKFLDGRGLDLSCPLYKEQALRQSSHVYHSLYRGKLDEITVIDSPNSHINKRDGVITQYVPKDAVFKVKLCSKNHPVPSVHVGEDHSIPAEYLHQKHKDAQESDFPISHPVVINMRAGKDNVQASFNIERGTIDAIKSSLPHGKEIHISFVRPFVIGTKMSKELSKTLLKEEYTITRTTQEKSNPRWSYYLSEGVFFFKSRRRIKTKEAISDELALSYKHCPCHRNLSCTYATQCGPCQVPEPDEEIHGCEEKEVKKNPSQAPLDLEYLSKPDDIQFQFPFYTSSSMIPHASLHLNELNMMKNFKFIKTEEEIMQRLSAYTVSVTNRDIYSLYPQNKITGQILALGIAW